MARCVFAALLTIGLMGGLIGAVSAKESPAARSNPQIDYKGFADLTADLEG